MSVFVKANELLQIHCILKGTKTMCNQTAYQLFLKHRFHNLIISLLSVCNEPCIFSVNLILLLLIEIILIIMVNLLNYIAFH